MNTFSKMNGIPGVSNASTSVWKIEKKRKTRDRKQRFGDDLKKEKKEEDKRHDIQADNNNPDSKEQVGYGPNKTKKNRRLKIDIKI